MRLMMPALPAPAISAKITPIIETYSTRHSYGYVIQTSSYANAETLLFQYRELMDKVFERARIVFSTESLDRDSFPEQYDAILMYGDFDSTVFDAAMRATIGGAFGVIHIPRFT